MDSQPFDLQPFLDFFTSNLTRTGATSSNLTFYTPDGYKFTITIEKINKGV